MGWFPCFAGNGEGCAVGGSAEAGWVGLRGDVLGAPAHGARFAAVMDDGTEPVGDTPRRRSTRPTAGPVLRNAPGGARSTRSARSRGRPGRCHCIRRARRPGRSAVASRHVRGRRTAGTRRSGAGAWVLGRRRGSRRGPQDGRRRAVPSTRSRGHLRQSGSVLATRPDRAGRCRCSVHGPPGPGRRRGGYPIRVPRAVP